MKFVFIVFNFVILYTNADVTTDLGSIDLSASMGEVKPLYQPLQPDDVKASKNGIDHVEWLRSKFPTGFKHMPTLDPFKISSLKPVHIQKGIVEGDVVLSNLRVDGAKEFCLNLAEIRMSINTMNMNISLPQIIGNVDIDADILFGIIPITFSGHLQSILTGLNIVGVFGLTETLIDGLKVYQVNADKIQITADKLQLSLSDLPTEPEEQIIKEWWDILKDDIVSLINNVMVQEVNDIIRNYSTQQVRDFLLAP